MPKLLVIEIGKNIETGNREKLLKYLKTYLHYLQIFNACFIIIMAAVEGVYAGSFTCISCN